MEGSMSGMGGGGPAPLSASGVDFSNPTQAMDFLGAMLDDSVFQVNGNTYARYFWYGVAVFIALAAISDVVWRTMLRVRIRAAAANHPRPATPTNVLSKSMATVTALFRELSYPQWTPLRNAFGFQVPALGTLLVLLAYLAFILALEFVNNDVPGAQHYTALAIRAAWLAIAQVPLLILLAGKNNLVGVLTGVSYERLNVFHRWVARGMLLLATLHFGYQNYGWNVYGLRHLEWTTDTCPPTGIAAYALLLWINLSTVAPLRHWSYEFFVIQHILTFFGFVVAIMMHLPSTALYSRVYIYISIALYLVDRIVRSVRWGANNFRPGQATLLAVDDGGVTKIRLRNPQVKKWTPGAFVLLSIPRFGFAQSHPATIASTPTSHGGDLVFLLKSHGGFTKRILDSCPTLSLAPNTNQKPESTPSPPPPPPPRPEQNTYRAFVDGPYGASHANFASFDTVVLIAGSTGITFILPLLLDIAHRTTDLKQKLPVRRVEVIWMVKSSSCTAWVADELQAASTALHEVGIEIEIKVHVTCDERLTDSDSADTNPSRGKEEGCPCQCDASLGPCCCASPASDSDDEVEPPSESKDASASPSDRNDAVRSRPETDAEKDPSPVTRVTTTTITEKTPRNGRLECAKRMSGRPDFPTVLWNLLDEAQGETGVAVCGPLGLSTAVRSAVVHLSDQRAVHKGTGAQGIYLHVEGFCW